MSAVRPEFGPTLPEVAGPVLARLPRGARIALAAAAVAVAAIAVWALLLRGDDRTVVVVQKGPVTFNLAYDDGLRRAEPAAGQMLALRGEGMSMTVSALRLPPYEGDSSGTLPMVAARMATEMARTYEGFTVRQEGRGNVNRQQGYEIFFQFRRDGATWYGRRTMLLPVTTGRDGVDIVLEARRTGAIPKFSSIGQQGPLKVAFRTFRFGTERP